MSDEMPANRNADMWHFRQRLLHPVLANVADPRFPCRERRLWTVSLCYCDDGDRLRVPAAPRRLGDALTYPGDSIDEPRVWHRGKSSEQWKGCRIRSLDGPSGQD